MVARVICICFAFISLSLAALCDDITAPDGTKYDLTAIEGKTVVGLGTEPCANCVEEKYQYTLSICSPNVDVCSPAVEQCSACQRWEDYTHPYAAACVGDFQGMSVVGLNDGKGVLLKMNGEIGRTSNLTITCDKKAGGFSSFVIDEEAIEYPMTARSEYACPVSGANSKYMLTSGIILTGDVERTVTVNSLEEAIDVASSMKAAGFYYFMKGDPNAGEMHYFTSVTGVIENTSGNSISGIVIKSDEVEPKVLDLVRKYGKKLSE
mmetsp:Transcript_5173/g.5631  ORF Transcript_5173/g.5631 Transcript_5173/m.5631 type:complete len:265 (-) Transcript_5173:94-888(-)|eukprot:CAMPEP_0168518588 /NCGR_PEP_ID=MMETSP0405-20121227/6802_1 /TAXON_ID=498012 /ORGANISM="Trichosphaerium sp, Strain Am-I-7 wt" /LENGTH=264 /DNA_ID=CAMNT_0008538949 /DNA_START=43 /DNA_END=837 /DNA_ORIENTATION=+